MSEYNSDFAESHKVGYLFKPKGVSLLPSLSASRDFMAPKRVDCRDYTTPCEDQGNSPKCAAYACANWAEAMMWKRTGNFEQIKPDWIYDWAKQNDGMPDDDGTTIPAVLEALRGSLYEKDLTRVRIIKSSRLSVKFALHKYGLILGGFNISADWYSRLNTSDSDMITGKDEDGNAVESGLGGHCVLLCGYDKQGVWFQNSWGSKFMYYGLGKISWEQFDKQFIMGGVLAGCLNGIDVSY